MRELSDRWGWRGTAYCLDLMKGHSQENDNLQIMFTSALRLITSEKTMDVFVMNAFANIMAND